MPGGESVSLKDLAGPDGTGAIAPHVPDPIVPARVGNYVAFDPSLTACGWVWFSADHSGQVRFFDSGEIRCGAEVTTQLGKLEAANTIAWESELVLRWCAHAGVMMESPAGVRPGFKYSEAPILAAAAIYRSVKLLRPETPVELLVTQKAKVRLTGDKKATKAKVRKAINTLYPDIDKSLRVRVESVYDAIAVGLTLIETPAKKA